MCGFAGLLTPPTHTPPSQVVAGMSSAIAHRGPDASGTWCDPAIAVVLAHRRLAIVDLSPAGSQPMHSGSGRWVITFNGEIYNHAELRTQLDSAETTFRGHSDTETLLAALDRWGLRRTLGRLDGMYAFAAWDRRERELHLVRDPLGEKPLYWGWAGRDLIFGSELSSLLAHPNCPRTVDARAAAALLRYKYIPAPNTILEGIHKLRAGSMVTVRAESGKLSFSHEVHWDPVACAAARFENRRPREPQDAIDELEEILLRSVRRRTMADVPVGAFLSGGIDSSAVVAMLSSIGPSRTFSIGFDVPELDEAPHARDVAAHLGTNHTELYVSESDLLALAPRMAEMYSEPFADSSQIPTALISELARKHVTVVLSGDGGDELFGGYQRYARAEEVLAGFDRIPLVLRRLGARALRSFGTNHPAARVPDLPIIPAHLRGRALGIGAAGRARMLGAEGATDLYHGLISDWDDPALALVLPLDEEISFPRVEVDAHPRERMMLTDLVSYLPEDILVKVDRASMAFGLETRVPLLQRELVEFSFGLPYELKVRSGVTKFALRAVAERHIPPALLDRPKMGFGVPLDQWLRGPLRPWVEELLTPSRLTEEGSIDTPVVRQIWQAHLDGHGDWSRWLWPIVMFQAWREHWLRGR